MTRHEYYRGYMLFTPTGYTSRIFIDGSGISCNEYFYNIDKAREHIDFTLKYIIKVDYIREVV